MALELLWSKYMEGVSAAGFKATEVYKCPWDERLDYLTGSSTFMGTKHDLLDVWCQDVTIEGIGVDDAGGPKYAIVTVTYGPGSNGRIEDAGRPYSETPVASFDFYTDSMTVGTGTYTFYSDNFDTRTLKDSNVDRVSEVKLLPRASITVSYDSASMLSSTHMAKIGKINNSAITIAGQNFPEETILFLGVSSRYLRFTLEDGEVVTPTDKMAWELNLKAAYNGQAGWRLNPAGDNTEATQGWNVFYIAKSRKDGAGGQWQRCGTNSTMINGIYETADLGFLGEV